MSVPPPAGSWRRWVVATTLGELLGFGGVAALGGLLATWLLGDDEPLALYLFAVALGSGEGAVLGWFQWRELRTLLPAVRRRAWIGNTAAAASFAWALGMLAPTLDALFGLTSAAQIAIWVPAGLLILLSIGAAQALALRGVVERPRRWVWANVTGWLLGLPWTFVLPGLLPDDAPLAAFAACFVVAGCLMGATVGGVTGRCLMRFQPLAREPAGSPLQTSGPTADPRP